MDQSMDAVKYELLTPEYIDTFSEASLASTAETLTRVYARAKVTNRLVYVRMGRRGLEMATVARYLQNSPWVRAELDKNDIWESI